MWRTTYRTNAGHGGESLTNNPSFLGCAFIKATTSTPHDYGFFTVWAQDLQELRLSRLYDLTSTQFFLTVLGVSRSGNSARAVHRDLAPNAA